MKQYLLHLLIYHHLRLQYLQDGYQFVYEIQYYYVLIQGFEEGFDLDGDSGDSPTGQGVLDGLLFVDTVNFDDVTLKMKNDTGYEFDESDFIMNEGDATGTDYDTWKAGWTVE